LTHVVIFAGGGAVSGTHIDAVAAADLVVAADSGAELARSLGWTVDELIGDFDSIEPATAAWAQSIGAAVHAHSPDKDRTDLELALELAIERGATSVSIIGGHGGRLDHLAANLALVADSRWPATITWFAGADRLEVVRGSRVFRPGVGATLTVLPAGDRALGVSIEGVRWPLKSVTLHRGSTLGVSNEATDDRVRIQVESGVVLAIFPDVSA
jgi:thiamine pyrophosphokinase